MVLDNGYSLNKKFTYLGKEGEVAKFELYEVYKTDKYYLNWMINQDFSSAVKDIITVALEGKFPQPSDP